MYQAVFPDPNDPVEPPGPDPDEEIIDDPIYDDEVLEDLPEEEQGEPVGPN